MIENTDVLILCGGMGRRLRTVSGDRPKSMVLAGGQPFLNILMGYLRASGFRRFILATGYRADMIRKYYEGHPVRGAEIVFSRETRALGTAGAIKNAEKLVKSDPFLALNGDSFTRFDAHKFLRFYSKKRAKYLLLLRNVKDRRDYGSIRTARDSQIVSFNEKSQDKRKGFINSGIYLFSREIFSRIPKNKKVSLELDVFPSLAGKGLYGYNKQGFFIDIGTPERYLAAKKYFQKARKDSR